MRYHGRGVAVKLKIPDYLKSMGNLKRLDAQKKELEISLQGRTMQAYSDRARRCIGVFLYICRHCKQ